jgi:hypothetical protein
MRHINNDPNKLLLQNALLAQQVAETAKNRQAERARSQSAEDIEKLHQQIEQKEVKKVSGNTEEGKGGQRKNSRNFQNWRYHPDGTLEEKKGPAEGPDLPTAKRIDIKA